MNDNCCNKCNSCNSCNKCGGGCCPARYDCSFNIEMSPYDQYTWIVTTCGMPHKVKIPKLPETCTSLSVNGTDATLVYKGECDTDIITGSQLGSIIRLNDLKDVDAPFPDHCSMLVFDPYCAECGDGCVSPADMWRPYSIPDAGDCIVPLEDDGYYKVLVKDDCGCIKECRLPAKPDDEDKIIYLRDSTPEDPDYPWYYGIYNETINLYLEQNVPKWFGKYDLEITVNYDIQVCLSHYCENMNYRSLVVPVVAGEAGDAAYDSSILQGQSTFEDIIPGTLRGSPWGTVTQRSSITFVVPKGKEAYLHHEFRLRNGPNFPYYKYNATYDGKRIPDDKLQDPDHIEWTGSRLHALQCIIKPTSGEIDKNPTRDPIRDQLDYGEDWYANTVVGG